MSNDDLNHCYKSSEVHGCKQLGKLKLFEFFGRRALQRTVNLDIRISIPLGTGAFEAVTGLLDEVLDPGFCIMLIN